MSCDTIYDQISRVATAVSLDEPFPDAPGFSLREVMTSLAPSPEAQVAQSLERERIWEALDSLSIRSRVIFALRHELTLEPLTFKQIGEAVGVSGQRIKQIDNRVLGQLRTALGNKSHVRSQ